MGDSWGAPRASEEFIKTPLQALGPDKPARGVFSQQSLQAPHDSPGFCFNLRSSPGPGQFKEAGGQLGQDSTRPLSPWWLWDGDSGAGATGRRKPPVSTGGQAWPGRERAAGRAPLTGTAPQSEATLWFSL